jgi:hypothetical protein
VQVGPNSRTESWRSISGLLRVVVSNACSGRDRGLLVQYITERGEKEIHVDRDKVGWAGVSVDTLSVDPCGLGRGEGGR